MNWKDVPIPAKMQDMEKDVRGYPIPYIILRHEGKPYFIVNDEHKVFECIVKMKCAICGKPLEDDVWLVGGILSALHPNGAYKDTPIHHECGQYALKVCPYLAMGREYVHESVAPKMQKKIPHMIFVDPTMIPERPDMFIFVKAQGISVSPQLYVRPHKPFAAYEFWKDGVQLTEAQAAERLKGVKEIDIKQALGKDICHG